MIAEPRVVFLVFFLAAMWFLTFVLLIRALLIISRQRAGIAECLVSLRLAAHILAAQDEVISSYRPPEPPPASGAFSSQA